MSDRRHIWGRDDGVIIRRARKTHDCDGVRMAGSFVHHRDCPRWIGKGLQYVEYLGETPAFTSGTRYSIPCAIAAWGRIDGLTEGAA